MNFRIMFAVSTKKPGFWLRVRWTCRSIWGEVTFQQCSTHRLLFTGSKKRTWRIQQRGFGHFITQVLLGSGRPGQHGELRCTYPQGDGCIGEVACPLCCWSSSDVSWILPSLHTQGPSTFIPPAKIGDKGSAQLPSPISLMGTFLRSFEVFLSHHQEQVSPGTDWCSP